MKKVFMQLGPWEHVKRSGQFFSLPLAILKVFQGWWTIINFGYKWRDNHVVMVILENVSVVNGSKKIAHLCGLIVNVTTNFIANDLVSHCSDFLYP